MSNLEGWIDIKPKRPRKCGSPPPVNNNQANNTKTLLCRYYLQNNCGAGSKCNFAHGENELRLDIQATRKTILREHHISPEGCKYDTLVCNFAHGYEDLRKAGKSSCSHQAGQTAPREDFNENENELVSSGSAVSTHSANRLGVQAAARKAAATSTSPTAGHTDAQTRTEAHTDSDSVPFPAPAPIPVPVPDCVVCEDSPRETTLAPCGHKICCKKCTERLFLRHPFLCLWCETQVDSFILKTICPA